LSGPPPPDVVLARTGYGLPTGSSRWEVASCPAPPALPRLSCTKLPFRRGTLGPLPLFFPPPLVRFQLLRNADSSTLLTEVERRCARTFLFLDTLVTVPCSSREFSRDLQHVVPLKSGFVLLPTAFGRHVLVFFRDSPLLPFSPRVFSRTFSSAVVTTFYVLFVFIFPSTRVILVSSKSPVRAPSYLLNLALLVGLYPLSFLFWLVAFDCLSPPSATLGNTFLQTLSKPPPSDGVPWFVGRPLKTFILP